MADRSQDAADGRLTGSQAPAEAVVRVTDAHQAVETIDGDELPLTEARRICQRNTPHAPARAKPMLHCWDSVDPRS